MKTQNHKTASSVADESDYASLTAFSGSLKSITGPSPINSKDKNIITIKGFETPIGPMLAGAVPEGICLLEFTDRRMLETEFKTLNKLLNAVIIQGENTHIDVLQQQLNEYFAGERKEFQIPLVAPGTGFQQAVWKELQTIPYGSTRSYKRQASALKRPEAIRAVANANGMNRIAILIPCHRVIGEDGSMTGYGGGIWRKKWLLDLEQTHTGKTPKLLF